MDRNTFFQEVKMATSKSKHNRSERRQYPRVNRNIQVKMQTDSLGYDVKGETHDLSPVGTYCQVDRKIPEMTRLMMIFDLPTDSVKCEGTVVRSTSDKERSNLFHLAIFFSEISEASKHCLAQFCDSP
jgi:c-di-GMP-binding flagellar brake protein YcgR